MSKAHDEIHQANYTFDELVDALAQTEIKLQTLKEDVKEYLSYCPKPLGPKSLIKIWQNLKTKIK